VTAGTRIMMSGALVLVLSLGGAHLFAGSDERSAGRQAVDVRTGKDQSDDVDTQRKPEQADPKAGVAVEAEPEARTEVAEEEKPYTVVCETDNGRRACKVDQATFVGWRTFHGFCAQCHAQDAVGSTFAPSLLARMPRVDRERFEHVVAEGFAGQMGVMPGFKDNPNVMPRTDELFAYLKARADGILPGGRPDRLPRD
jgi:hypothetical protein